MRTAVGYLIVVILLLTSGEVVRRAATFEDALAATQEHLATQNPADTPAPEDDARGVQLLASLPVIGRPIRTDLLRQRALAAYWRGDYSGADLLARRSSESEVGSGPRNGTNPEPEAQPADDVTRFIAANALFRDLARQGPTVEGVFKYLQGFFGIVEAMQHREQAVAFAADTERGGCTRPQRDGALRRSL